MFLARIARQLVARLVARLVASLAAPLDYIKLSGYIVLKKLSKAIHYQSSDLSIPGLSRGCWLESLKGCSFHQVRCWFLGSTVADVANTVANYVLLVTFRFFLASIWLNRPRY